MNLKQCRWNPSKVIFMDEYGKILPRHNDDENPTEVEITFPNFFEDKDPKGPFIYYVSTSVSMPSLLEHSVKVPAK